MRKWVRVGAAAAAAATLFTLPACGDEPGDTNPPSNTPTVDNPATPPGGGAPSPSGTLTTTGWVEQSPENIPVQIPDTWQNTVVPGADAAWTVPGGAAVGLTFTTPNPTPVTEAALRQLSETVTQSAPQLAPAGDIEQSPQRGYLKFADGSRTLHVWLAVTPTGVWTVTLGQPYQPTGEGAPPPERAAPEPSAADVAQVEQFIARNQNGDG